MPQLLGRDAVIRRVTAAVDRALGAGGGTVVVSGPAGVGTTAVVDEALRPLRAKLASVVGRCRRETDAAIWWIDDVQRMPRAEVERLREAAATRVVVVSGRRPLGAEAADLVRECGARATPAPSSTSSRCRRRTRVAAVGAGDIDAARACGGRLRLLGV